jgi:NitT/TauT family transport system substrate-binding protein
VSIAGIAVAPGAARSTAAFVPSVAAFVPSVFVSSVLFLCALGCHTISDTDRIRIAIGGQNQLIYLPTTLAAELGYYREEGLDVELQDFQGGAKALQAAVGGSAEVVSGFYDHTIQMAAEGKPFTAFVTMTNPRAT